ncbi:glycerophosphodiester phosphodiesterase family protein [Aurantimonas sp. VKM B-3413]|uniref:glycerophosphodiester phosphodiesterase n=1 Tax=Aurantimonas sp. VKM B-3413 TaxID=2779401 RepID=UPI001E61010B|nr:glycerophosphodiester phosphodiesterase family protein [Aurantimonas sp. VKM B-3413]MCB8836215.1 glycerophosphodiester phosphodiesterase [Aurantimonas sp. VKM B-3413]
MARPTSLPLIVAHRGFSTAHRENSPAAWIAAVEAGADVVEVDIRTTRDGKLVCCHDADLRRLADRTEAIADIDAAELAGIAVAGAPATPTLEELFKVLPLGQAIVFDVKDERAEVLDLLVAAATASGRGGLIFGLHRIASVTHVRMRTDAAILGLLSSLEDVDAFFAVGGDILRLWESDATAERVGAWAACGRPVWVTTGEGITGRKVGDFAPDKLRRMTAEGVCGFLVNDPLAARDALLPVLQETGA